MRNAMEETPHGRDVKRKNERKKESRALRADWLTQKAGRGDKQVVAFPLACVPA